MTTGDSLSINPSVHSPSTWLPSASFQLDDLKFIRLLHGSQDSKSKCSKRQEVEAAKSLRPGPNSKVLLLPYYISESRHRAHEFQGEETPLIRRALKNLWTSLVCQNVLWTSSIDFSTPLFPLLLIWTIIGPCRFVTRINELMKVKCLEYNKHSISISYFIFLKLFLIFLQCEHCIKITHFPFRQR